MAFIRTEVDEDIRDIHAIYQEAFGRTTEGDLVHTLRDTNYFTKDLSLVATMDNRCIGHLLFVRIVIKDDKRSYPVLALTSIAIDPAFQKQGIGTELLEEGLQRAKFSGHKAVIVLGNPKFYSAFGFELASLYEITPPSTISEDTFLIKQLSSEPLPIKGQVYYPVELM